MRNPFESFETFIQDHFVKKDQNNQYKKLYLDFKQVTDCLHDWFKAHIPEYLNQFPKDPSGMRINYKNYAKEHLEFIDHIQSILRDCARECKYKIPGLFSYYVEYFDRYKTRHRGRSFTKAKKAALKKKEKKMFQEEIKREKQEIIQKQKRMKHENLFRPLQQMCNVTARSFDELDDSLGGKMEKLIHDPINSHRLALNKDNLDIMDQFLIKYIQENHNEGHGILRLRNKIQLRGRKAEDMYRAMIPYLKTLYESIIK